MSLFQIDKEIKIKKATQFTEQCYKKAKAKTKK